MIARDLLFEQPRTGSSGDDDRRLSAVASSVEPDENDCHGPIGLLAAIKQPNGGVGYPAGPLVLFKRDRSAVSPRGRIRRSVFPELNDGAAKVLALDTEFVHVAS